MKEFNLERALAGDPVVTRKNVPVTEVIKVSTITEPYNVLAVINGAAVFVNEKGVFSEGDADVWDLFMAPVKKQEWANIYKSDISPATKYIIGMTYESDKLAKESLVNLAGNYINTVLIREWEE